MKRTNMALALLTFSFLLPAASCGDTRRIVEAQIPPAERMDCRELEGDRPALPREYEIEWGSIETLEQARAEHDAYVASVRSRESVTASYILTVEGRLFACADDAEWLRDFFADLDQGS